MLAIDSRSERFLESLGAKYRYSNEVLFSDLPDTWYRENLGRSQVKVKAAIQEYGSLMDSGSAAPAPILWRRPDGKYEVLDGVQRLLAEEARKSLSFSAYIVDTDSLILVKKIRVFANYRLQGGFQESSEWTLAQAITVLVNSGEMSIEEVADIGGWPLCQVRDKKQIMDVGESIRGVGGPEKMPDTVIRLISRNAAREDFEAAPASIAEFLNDIHHMRLSAEDADPYIEQFFSVVRSKKRLFDQFRKKLKEFRDDEEVAARLADPTRHRHQAMSAEGRVLKALKAALTTAKNVLERQEPIYEMAEYFQLVNQIKTVLTKIERLSKKVSGRR